MVFSSNETIPTIPEFYKGRHVLITGGAGFVGKVLIEKLLRSCPDVGNVYVLLREKKGTTAEERIKVITNFPLFDLLKQQNGDALNKLIPVSGDVAQLHLGLSAKDRNTIIDQVSIIFHVAASIRFNDPLKYAILNNTRGTREAIYLAQELKNSATFVHVSTIYCNFEMSIIEEKIYPFNADWRNAIKVAEEMDDRALEILSQKYIHPLPNTYVFTKRLAEHVVQDLCVGKISAIILRPSVVLNALREPMTGWTDSYSGPFILTAAFGTGIMRSIYGQEKTSMDNVFVDNFAKSLLIATWEKSTKTGKKDNILVYNCCSELKYTFGDFNTTGVQILKEVPLQKKIWAHSNKPVTQCWYNYFISTILFQVIPAIFFDFILKVLGKKPIFLMLQRKLYIGWISIFCFVLKNLEFRRDNYMELESKLLSSDLEKFSFLVVNDYSKYEDRLDIFKKCYNGLRMYLLKESAAIEKRTIQIDKRWKMLDKAVRYLWYGTVLYIIWKYDILLRLSDRVVNYFKSI